MLLKLTLFLILPAALSYLVTPAVIRLASPIGAMDHPNERKIHRNPIPRLGGVAIYVALFSSILIVSAVDGVPHPLSFMTLRQSLVLVFSLLLVLLVGIWDDIRALSPARKFLVQLAAVTILYAAGFRISMITHPLGAGAISLGLLEYPVTVLWIVGVTNAFNLIDGLDGLASGVATIASVAVFAISYLNGHYVVAMTSLLLAGTFLGFLRYNFNPARIFLGDSGSLFTGFLLALLSMVSSTKGSAAFAIIVPVLALGLPIMDTLLSMVRRLIGSFYRENGKRDSLPQKLSHIFAPDRKHIHHQLLARGIPHRTAVLLLYLVSCGFGLAAFAVTLSNNVGASLILIALAIATVVGVRQLHYVEMAFLRNGILLPLYDWPLMNRSLFQSFLDLAFVAVAFVISILLTYEGVLTRSGKEELLSLGAAVGGVQLAAFYVCGLYRNTFRFLGIGDLLKIIKAIALAGIAGGLVLWFVPKARVYLSPTMLLLDIYVLLTLVVGTRISFHVLNYLFRRENTAGKRVLLYGADAPGIATLHQILNDDTLGIQPVGFLDDRPDLEGKQVNGYAIYGGHWKLERILKKFRIDQILITGNGMRPTVLKRLEEIAARHRVGIRKVGLQLEEVPVGSRHQRPLVAAQKIHSGISFP